MNRLIENRTHVARQLGRLDVRRRTVFAAACAERLFPAFARYASRANAAALREVLEHTWRYTEGADLSAAAALELERQCDRLAPETEGDPSPYVSAALNAAIAVAAATRCVSQGAVDGTGTAAEAVTDTIYQSLIMIDLNDPDHWSKVLAHPVMLREFEWQRSDIDSIKRGASAAEVRAAAQDRGLQLLASLERLLFQA